MVLLNPPQALLPVGRKLKIDVKRLFLLCCLASLAVTGCRQKQELRKASPSPESPPATAAPPSSQPATMAQGAARPAGPIQFVDVTSQAGISFKHNSGAFGKK